MNDQSLLDVIRLNQRTEKGERVPFLSIEYFEYDLLRSQVHQLRVQVVVAIPLAAEPIEPLVELPQRRSLQVGAGGVDFAQCEVNESVVVAVVGIDQVMQHGSLLCMRSVATLFS